MQPEESVTEWIEHLKRGDANAARNLWERYFASMVHLARRHLAGVRPAAADEEDVVLNAFASFCRAMDRGRFPQLNDRDDLWRVLVCLTERKAIDLIRGEQRLKRGGNAASETTLEDSKQEDRLARLPGREPSPVFAAQMAEECQRLLDLLGDDQLRELALHKLEGYSNEELAGKLGCALRTVERKLNLIRNLWEAEVSR
jgi:RNA polymerase sigma factor (sigma-70 family)